jgi:hypothetical protein
LSELCSRRQNCQHRWQNYFGCRCRIQGQLCFESECFARTRGGIQNSTTRQKTFGIQAPRILRTCTGTKGARRTQKSRRTANERITEKAEALREDEAEPFLLDITGVVQVGQFRVLTRFMYLCRTALYAGIPNQNGSSFNHHRPGGILVRANSPDEQSISRDLRRFNRWRRGLGGEGRLLPPHGPSNCHDGDILFNVHLWRALL